MLNLNWKRWEIFYIPENLINNLDYSSDKKRPCVVLQVIGNNVIAAEVTSQFERFNLPLSTKIGNYENSFLKISYIFTIDFKKNKKDLKKINQKLSKEDRENILYFIEIDNLNLIKSEQDWKKYLLDSKNSENIEPTSLNKKRTIKGTRLNNLFFQDQDLTDIKILKSDVSNSNFSKAKLINGLILSSALNNSNFKQSIISKLNVNTSTLQGSNFEKSNIDNCQISGSTLEKSKFIKSKISNSIFISSAFSNTNFSGSVMENVQFDNCRLVESDFNLAKLKNVTFKGCTMKIHNLKSNKKDNVNFENCLFI